MCKYPDVTVQLSGNDGNAFYILGAVKRAMREAEVSEEEIDQCMTEMKSGDYRNLLGVAHDWVNVL